MAKTSLTHDHIRQMQNDRILFSGPWELEITGTEQSPQARLTITLALLSPPLTVVQKAMEPYGNEGWAYRESALQKGNYITITNPELIAALLDNKKALKAYKSKNTSRPFRINLIVNRVLQPQGHLPLTDIKETVPSELMAFLCKCGIHKDNAGYFKPAGEDKTAAQQVITALNPALPKASPLPTSPEAIEQRYNSRIRQIERLCGHERENKPPNYEAVVHQLNIESRLGLTPFQEHVETLMLTALGKGDRFAGSPLITRKKGENAAKHSAMAVVKSDNVFERAGVLTEGSLESQAYAETLRKECALGTLVHDQGEILGEASTVDGRTKKGKTNGEGDGRGSTEEQICEYAMYLAARAIETGNIENRFYEKIAELKEAANVKEKGYAEIAELIPPEEMERIKHSVNEQHRTDTEHLLKHLKYAELEPKDRDFRCWLIKGVEHLEGTQHLMKKGKLVQLADPHSGQVLSRPFMGVKTKAAIIEMKPRFQDSFLDGHPPRILGKKVKDIPLVTDKLIVDSFMVTTSFYYNERELGHLWQEALENKNPVQREVQLKLAKQHTLDVYHSLVEFLDRRPPQFRLVNPAAMNGQERKDIMDEIKKGRKIHSIAGMRRELDNEEMAKKLGKYPVVKSQAVKALYQAAIELVEQGKFHPQPGEVLLETGKQEYEILHEPDGPPLKSHQELLQRAAALRTGKNAQEGRY